MNALDKPRTRRRLGTGIPAQRRHPLEVTADRLGDHLERYFDHFDGSDRDEISHVRFMLQQIAERERGGES